MSQPKRLFRTLRGFLEGHEPDEETYFAYSATLRIFGHIPDMQQITDELGITPTYTHRAGERRGHGSPPFKHDMWSFTPDVAEAEPLEHHINALWTQIQHKKAYLLGLKQKLNVDVFLGYQSNCDHAGIVVPHSCLEMFTELEIPFGLSVIVV